MHDHNYDQYANKAKCWISEGKADFNSINTFWDQVNILQSNIRKVGSQKQNNTHTEERELKKRKKERKEKKRRAKKRKKKDSGYLFRPKYCQ